MKDEVLGNLSMDETKLAALGSALSVNSERMPLTVLHGFLTALISSPELAKPSEWLPYVLGIDPSMKADVTDDMVHLLMSFHNKIAGDLLNEETYSLITYTSHCIHTEKTATEGEITDWCQGYIEGMHFDACWDDEAVMLAFPIAVLAKEMNLKGTLDANGNMIEDDTEHLKTFCEMLPEVIQDIYFYFLEQRLPRHTPASSPKIGRNERCPCGSGLKYKKCCLNETEVYH